MDTLEIPIFRKTYELYKEFYGRRKQFPKADRYVLGQQCEGALVDILRMLFQAGSVSKQDKAAHLDRASIELNMLRIYFRMAKDIKAVDVKTYVALEERVDEIGRMLGGWRKSVQRDS